MNNHQPGILDDLPNLGRYLTFTLKPGASPTEPLKNLGQKANGKDLVVGLGKSLIETVGGTVPNLGTFPTYASHGVEIPSTPAALWCWLRGADRGDLVNQSRTLKNMLDAAFFCTSTIDAFKHGDGRDLSGYEDGTENPKGDEANEAALVNGSGSGHDGSSYVAVQTWVHNLDFFKSLPQKEQDHTIGRRLSDNEELDDAPASAHTKRTEQESFSPEAIVLRRSMPWADACSEGLNFVAFGRDFYAFEAQLARMAGAEDGITDALFNFSKPISGSYFWCPPMKNGILDLSAIGL